MTKKPMLLGSIKAKLISATCMLLVAVIMVVSSTYAWFTLSTAPEVTGITTAVGANGALEMALFTGDTNIKTSSGSINGEDINTYWGNLVDLSGASYGLQHVVLYPSILNMVDADTLDKAKFLQTPEYGADGRVEKLVSEAVTGQYDATAKGFLAITQGDGYGVRALGIASGMTPRQHSYRNALADASTAMSKAQTLAAQSLNNNGSKLANIALKHGTATEEKPDKYTAKDLEAVWPIVTAYTADGGILDQLDAAYMNYVLAYIAGDAMTDENAENYHTLVKSMMESAENLAAFVSAIKTDGSGWTAQTIPTEIETQLNKVIATRTKVEAAAVALDTLDDTVTGEATATWEQIRPILVAFANPEDMLINGYKTSELKDHMSDLINSVAGNGLQITIATGGGAYADVADHCGDYNAAVVIEQVEYNGLVLKNMNARMKTNGYVENDVKGSAPYLVVVKNAVETLSKYPSGAAQGDLPMTEFYGYIMDLAFRTNAAESNLLLQVDATDRIYSDNSNEATMGHGSSMTFKSTTTDFSDAQVKALMDAIRIVFFNPMSGDVYANARLDTKDGATYGVDGWTAEMYIVGDPMYTVTKDDDSTVDCYRKTVTTGDGATATTTYEYYTNAAFSGEKVIPKDGTTPVEKLTKSTDNAIVALPQGSNMYVSAMVYLDGNAIDNSKVAATAASSMTGKMNLQFSSSANLVPMEYADLHTSNIQATNVELTVGSTHEIIGVTGAATYTSSVQNVATISNTGVITAVAPGTATVTVKDAAGATIAKYNVVVTAAPTSN